MCPVDDACNWTLGSANLNLGVETRESFNSLGLAMSQDSNVAVGQISHRLREWIHEVNNALFITKGFLEEIEADAKSRTYLKPNFDHDNFLEMIETVVRSVDRIDKNVQKLRKYAKEEVFVQSGVDRPIRRSETILR